MRVLQRRRGTTAAPTGEPCATSPGTPPFQKLVDTLDIASLQGFENVGVRTRDVEKLYFEVPPRERIERF